MFNSDYITGEVLQYARENGNRYSENAIVVMKGVDVIVGHISESLRKVLSPWMVSKTITHIEAVVDSKHRPAPEGAWTPGGGIEIPCI